MSAALPACLAAALIAAALWLIDAPVAVRAIFGLLAALFLPGHGLVALAFPRSADVDRAERIALSIGLSLSVTALAALALDRSAWGLAPAPLVSVLTAFTVVTTSLAWLRRARVATAGAARAPIQRPTPHKRPLAVTVAALVAGALCLAAFVTLMTDATSRSTEFYMLGPDDLAAEYPARVRQGERVEVVTGIVNREQSSGTYYVAVREGDVELLRTEPISVRAGETLTRTLTFRPREPGVNREIVIALYKDGVTVPYRWLRLWLDVLPA